MTTPHDNERLDHALETVDESKRSALRKMLAGAFAAPVVTTFAVSAMMVPSAVMAEPDCSNMDSHTVNCHPA